MLTRILSIARRLIKLPTTMMIAILFVLPPAIATPIPDILTAKQIGEQFGVTVTTTQDTCQFSVLINDTEKLSITSAPTQESLQQVWNQLSALSEQEERMLQEEFKVRLGHDGDTTTGEGYGPYSKRTYSVMVRSPKLRELYALEFALNHSAPSHLIGKSGRGVHVHFLKQRRAFTVIAEWGYDRDNQPAIFIEPGYYNTVKGKHLELVLIHELAHNAEVRMGMDSHDPRSWKLASRLGWLPFSNGETGEEGWLMCSSEGSDCFYKLGAFSGLWVRCNRSGQPLSDEGHVVERQVDARRLTASQMMEVAQIKPATNYFSNPMEMFAEGMMLLRASRRHRQLLLSTNPALYELLKEQDQAEIDASFGGQRYTRTVDGLVAMDAPTIQQELSNFERTVIAALPPHGETQPDMRIASTGRALTAGR